MTYYDDSKFKHRNEPDDEDDDDEMHINFSVVGDALADPDWWGYGEMLFAMHMVTHEMQMNSRHCSCHASPSPDSPSFEAFRIWRQNEDKRQSYRSCPRGAPSRDI